MTMMLYLWLACGESVTYEELTPLEAQVADTGPSADAPVDVAEGGEEAEDAERAAVQRPQPGQAWPPVVVPEGPREREWEWDFKYKGATKTSRARAGEEKVSEKTLEELRAYEMERQAIIDRGR